MAIVRCPHCGVENDPQEGAWWYCTRCGKRLAARQVNFPPPPAAGGADSFQTAEEKWTPSQALAPGKEFSRTREQERGRRLPQRAPEENDLTKRALLLLIGVPLGVVVSVAVSSCLSALVGVLFGLVQWFLALLGLQTGMNDFVRNGRIVDHFVMHIVIGAFLGAIAGVFFGVFFGSRAVLRSRPIIGTVARDTAQMYARLYRAIFGRS
jgi:hypothetical protein